MEEQTKELDLDQLLVPRSLKTRSEELARKRAERLARLAQFVNEWEYQERTQKPVETKKVVSKYGNLINYGPQKPKNFIVPVNKPKTTRPKSPPKVCVNSNCSNDPEEELRAIRKGSVLKRAALFESSFKSILKDPIPPSTEGTKQKLGNNSTQLLASNPQAELEQLSDSSGEDAESSADISSKNSDQVMVRDEVLQQQSLVQISIAKTQNSKQTTEQSVELSEIQTSIQTTTNLPWEDEVKGLWQSKMQERFQNSLQTLKGTKYHPSLKSLSQKELPDSSPSVTNDVLQASLKSLSQKGLTDFPESVLHHGLQALQPSDEATSTMESSDQFSLPATFPNDSTDSMQSSGPNSLQPSLRSTRESSPVSSSGISSQISKRRSSKKKMKDDLDNWENVETQSPPLHSSKQKNKVDMKFNHSSLNFTPKGRRMSLKLNQYKGPKVTPVKAPNSENSGRSSRRKSILKQEVLRTPTKAGVPKVSLGRLSPFIEQMRKRFEAPISETE